jgi:glycosyltransferase involved in cell wall biosynthesis
VFVLPSHREGFPRAAMEAAASGLATVATDIRGCRQVVDDGVTGILVPLRAPIALAAAIRALGEDEARRVAMGVAAVARARANFDERRIVETVLDSYRRGPTRRRFRLRRSRNAAG